MRTLHAIGTDPGPARPGTVVAYLRLSDARGEDEGIERQEWLARKLAREEGLPEPQIVVGDGSASRYKRKGRAAFHKVCGWIEAGEVTDLIITYQDRWTREPMELETLINVIRTAPVRIHAAARGRRIDLTTSEGLYQARGIAASAAYESDHRSDRVKDASLYRAEKGRPHGGGRRPYAYDVHGMELVADEAAIVREMTDRVVDGESSRSIAGDLRTRRVPTATGGDWTAAGVRDMVWRARNAGLREHGGTRTVRGELTEAAWPACVPRESWQLACAILGDPKRRTVKGNNVSCLLSGLAKCWEGHPIVSGGLRNGRRSYTCKDPGRSGHMYRSMAHVDDVIVATLCGTDSVPGLLAAHGLGVTRRERETPPRVEAQLDALRAALSRAEDAYVSGVMTREGYDRNAKRLKAEIGELERQRVAVRAPEALDGIAEGCTPEEFRALPLDRQRAVVELLLDVVLLPARHLGAGRFDLESVQIRPKGVDTP